MGADAEGGCGEVGWLGMGQPVLEWPARLRGQRERPGGVSEWSGGVELPGRAARWSCQVELPGGADRWSGQVELPGGADRWSCQVELPGGADRWSGQVERTGGADRLIGRMARTACTGCRSPAFSLLLPQNNVAPAKAGAYSTWDLCCICAELKRRLCKRV